MKDKHDRFRCWKSLLCCSMVTGLMLAAPAMAAASSLFVQSAKAKLLANPKFSAPVVVSLKKGDQVDLIEKKGSWYMVKAVEGQGWVSRLLLANHPPLAKQQNAIKADSSTGKHARRRASAVATAGAARGLAAEDRHRKAQGEFVNYSALEAMEAVAVSDAEVAEFITRGLGL